MPSVIFLDSEPSEKEYFEEYNKYIGIFNAWFTLIFLLCCFAPFCLGLQVGPFEYPHSMKNYIKEFSINLQVNTTENIFDELKNYSSRMELKLMCDTILWMMNMKCIGFALGAAVGGILADLYGRRIISFTASTIWITVASYFITLNNNIMVEIFYVIITAFCSAINVCTFVNFSEIASMKYRILAVYSLAFYILADFLIKYISNTLKVWRYYMAFIASTLSCLILATWYTPDSPRWLLNKNKKLEAYRQLNEVSGLLYDIQNVAPTDAVPKMRVLKDMFRYLISHKLKPFIISNVLIGIVSVHYSCAKMQVILYYIRGEQFQTIENLAELLGHLFFLPAFMLLGKRNGLLFCCILLALESLLATMAFNDAASIYYNLFAVMAGISALNFCWLNFLDIVPTFLRCTVTGFGFFVFNLSRGSSLYILYKILHAEQGFGYHMAFFIISLLGISSLKLPDTYHLDLSNFKLY